MYAVLAEIISCHSQKEHQNAKNVNASGTASESNISVDVPTRKKSRIVITIIYTTGRDKFGMGDIIVKFKGVQTANRHET